LIQRALSTTRRAVGIDVGACAVHAVRVQGAQVIATDTFAAGDVLAVAAFCGDTDGVAIDAPAGLSAGAHLADLTVAAKFRTGRCSEVAARPAVPWMAPMAGMPVPGWMAVGFDVWSALRAAGHDPMEVFPAGCFHRLNGGRWPARKTTPAGRQARVELLRPFLSLPAGADQWTHDSVDAAVAALVAYQGRDGAVASPHACSRPDGSQMWFPTEASRCPT
jgi:predicted nuclease with RNAse H fold